MRLNTKHIDQILQYALLTAGEEDDFRDRDLGPIHLLKYVYLADLAYAEHNNGESYTGVEWQFYKFGPWSPAVHERIAGALSNIHANKQVFESKYNYDDEWIRWNLRDDRLHDQLGRELPFTITNSIKNYVHRFGKDTSSLLDYVYKTKPMLEARPMEYLDLSVICITTERSEPEITKIEKLSNKKKKKLSERMRALRAESAHRHTMANKNKKLKNPVSVKLYDAEVFNEGVIWLDELAGPKLTEDKITVEFSDEVWDSETRKGNNVS